VRAVGVETERLRQKGYLLQTALSSLPPVPPMKSVFSLWLQYLYFLRLSLFLWLLLPLLIFLDLCGVSTTITRGILILESGQQIFWGAFFIVSANLIGLIAARVVAVNGKARFIVGPPPFIDRFLGPSSEQRAIPALLFPLGLSLISLTAVGGISFYEGVTIGGSAWPILFYLSAGALSSLVFWFLVSLFFYWTFDSETAAESAAAGGRINAAPKPLLFPSSWFNPLTRAKRPAIANWLERLFFWVPRFSSVGYSESAGGKLWELHFFTIVAALGFLLLYLFLYPVAAPVELPHAVAFLWIFSGFPAIVFLAVIVTARVKGSRYVLFTKMIFIVTASLLLLTLLIRSWMPAIPDGFGALSNKTFLYAERGIPTLASFLVLSTFLLWILSGFAFFLDRYRVPVLTTFLLVLFLPKLIPLPTGEHYFSAREIPIDVPNAPIPEDIVRLKTAGREGQPLIVVTATGGGIHAAAWTAEILGDIERSFFDDSALSKAGFTFHDRILLASGVSGGSDGLMTFLSEYTAASPFASPQDSRVRMTQAANCSSLEAVAWGLEYADFSNLLFTVLPYPSSGSDFILRNNTAPDGHDRSWALEQAFNRNLKDGHCRDLKRNQADPGMLDGYSMTLSTTVRYLLAAKAGFPAFTFNTTAAETGDRFLLANYQIPDAHKRTSDVLPAESFLHSFGQRSESEAPRFHKKYADLPLAAAARMSATFPFVSSAARLPRAFANHSYHFVDGGYFDNDGTSSVIEFLRSALAVKNPAQLRILLVEIRDGWDLDAANNSDGFLKQAAVEGSGEDAHPKSDQPSAWRALQQLMAPAQTLWLAGHTSVTRRNRRELCLLEQSYVGNGDLFLHHVVFDYENSEDKHQPLNWHLTPRQRRLIEKEANKDRIKSKMDDAKAWTKRVLANPKDFKDDTDLCVTSAP
jgi:hypothetical protein